VDGTRTMKRTALGLLLLDLLLVAGLAGLAFLLFA
jgi:hypothetical protein